MCATSACPRHSRNMPSSSLNIILDRFLRPSSSQVRWLTACPFNFSCCKKVLIINGHGGNEHLLPLFAQAQMDKPHDYVVYVFWPMAKEAAGRPEQKDKVDMHGGESETSRTMISRPDLVHMDRVQQESGKDLARQKLPPDVYTGIWWYARFPNHYSGDASTTSKELGEFDVKTMINQIVEALKAIKADQVSLQLQNQFYEDAKHPLQTKPQ